ncbi:elongation factor G [Erysipelothrix sp. HDW6C]|uniref:elongation factor G n=1 Tax=Erysipelothrix sp. HDW6C TaxID=2714930 RepID=UPI001407FC15|nr:elongation factor G [Erysipelothrix sp. HDW6C]QIK70288.1 elongation factor G [Erysipelothrix sp. HDW6C]
MKDYRSEAVRNLVVLGHNGSGKSSVIQAMLFEAKQIDRIVSAESGQSVLDYEPLEIQRGQTLSTKLVPIEWRDHKINCIDTPGYADFVSETQSSFIAGDNVLIVVDAKEVVDEGTRLAFRWASESLKPCIFFVNKMDDPNVSFHRVYDDLRDNFGKRVIAFEMPIREEGKVIGSINLLSRKVWYYDAPTHPHDVPKEYVEQVGKHWKEICEAVAMTDDALMEDYFTNGTLNDEQIIRGVCLGVRSGEICPVYCGSANQGIGMRRLLDLITEYFPSYFEKGEIVAEDPKGNPVILRTHEDEHLSAQVFKTIVDPFVGRISYLKVLSGVLNVDSEVYNANRDESERVTGLFSINGKHQIGIGKLFAGDIGAVTKLQYTKTFDTLSTKQYPIIHQKPVLPKPLFGMAIWPLTKQDEDRVSAAIAKVVEEDVGARVFKDPDTSELVLFGMGNQHLEAMVSKLKDRYRVAVSTTVPKVGFRETIQTKVMGEGRHKKQSGGSGQFGHVFIEFEPHAGDEIIFETRIVGGSVPKQYFAAVEQGIREAMQQGVLAGYKVMGVKAVLTDGKYHDVDSKDIAFKQAARLAYLDAMPRANPVLMEPIVALDVDVADVYTGAVIGDLNKRRGIILNMEPLTNNHQRIHVEVPKVEVTSYLSDLRSLTQGSGLYSQAFVRYDSVPEALVDRLLYSNQ